MTSESQCTNSNLSRTMRLRSGNALFSKFPTLRPSNPFRSTNVGSLEHEDSLDQWTCPYCFKIIPASRSPIIDPEHCSCVEGGGMGSQSFDSQSNIPALVLNKVPCETRPRLGKEEVDRLETCFRTNPKPTTQKKRQFAEDMGVDLARINVSLAFFSPTQSIDLVHRIGFKIVAQNEDKSRNKKPMRRPRGRRGWKHWIDRHPTSTFMTMGLVVDNFQTPTRSPYPH